MIACCDPYMLLTEAQELGNRAVYVVQHDYIPKHTKKFLNQQQTTYPRKNWSSVMIFNNEKCKMLTPEYINSASGLELHRFLWLPDEEIGSLPVVWNWLVDEYPHNSQAKMLHYTNGGPWFSDYRNTDHAEDWYNEYKSMLEPIVGTKLC